MCNIGLDGVRINVWSAGQGVFVVRQRDGDEAMKSL